MTLEVAHGLQEQCELWRVLQMTTMWTVECGTVECGTVEGAADDITSTGGAVWQPCASGSVPREDECGQEGESADKEISDTRLSTGQHVQCALDGV